MLGFKRMHEQGNSPEEWYNLSFLEKFQISIDSWSSKVRWCFRKETIKSTSFRKSSSLSYLKRAIHTSKEIFHIFDSFGQRFSLWQGRINILTLWCLESGLPDNTVIQRIGGSSLLPGSFRSSCNSRSIAWLLPSNPECLTRNA